MIRTIVTVDGQLLQILLPADFIGKLVEVIAFPVQETRPPERPSKNFRKKKLTVVAVANKHFRFNRDELHER